MHGRLQLQILGPQRLGPRHPRIARRHGLAVDSELELTTGDVVERFRVRALLKDEGPARTLDGNFALMDIAAAQLAFQRLGRLNRVDVRLADGVNIDRAEKEIATAEIGAFVMQELKTLDKVAYVRFASVYRHFRDIGEFMTDGGFTGAAQ